MIDNVNIVVEYILKYGIIFLFFIVYLEYLNLPGLPGGVILPAIGVLIASNKYSFFGMFIVSVLAGVLGSISLYYVGYYLGNPLLEWIKKKFPKTQKSIDKAFAFSKRFGSKGVFVCRLVPVVRTIVSLISGTVKEDIVEFTIYSALGISIWNLVFIFGGYITSKTLL
ncbi:MAG: DedA family protein [Clostridium sp.]|nr:DedA family protein [Clostridium sp.]